MVSTTSLVITTMLLNASASEQQQIAHHCLVPWFWNADIGRKLKVAQRKYKGDSHFGFPGPCRPRETLAMSVTQPGVAPYGAGPGILLLSRIPGTWLLAPGGRSGGERLEVREEEAGGQPEESACHTTR